METLQWFLTKLDKFTYEVVILPLDIYPQAELLITQCPLTTPDVISSNIHHPVK